MFNEPIISDQLIKLGLSEHLIGKSNFINNIGYVFGLACLAYVVAAPLIAWLSVRFRKETLGVFSFTMSGV
jgi:hypothetical protein